MAKKKYVIKTMSFNGKEYYYHAVTPKKASATKTAKRLRKLGYKARVVKGRVGWEIYTKPRF